MKKLYELTVPITGLAYVTVEANSEEEAFEEALGSITISDIQEWEPLREVNRGNVCYAMQPWEITVESVEDVVE